MSEFLSPPGQALRPTPPLDKGWLRFSTEITANGVKIDLRSISDGSDADVSNADVSDPGVQALVVLVDDGPFSRAWVTFQSPAEGRAHTACLRAIALISAALADRSRSDTQPALDVRYLEAHQMPELGPGTWRLQLTGKAAQVALIAAFGDAYAEALP